MLKLRIKYGAWAEPIEHKDRFWCWADLGKYLSEQSPVWSRVDHRWIEGYSINVVDYHEELHRDMEDRSLDAIETLSLWVPGIQIFSNEIITDQDNEYQLMIDSLNEIHQSVERLIKGGPADRELAEEISKASLRWRLALVDRGKASLKEGELKTS